MVALVASTSVALGVLSFRNIGAAVVPAELGRMRIHVQQLAGELDDFVDEAREELMALRASIPVGGFVRAERSGGQDPYGGRTAAAWRERIAADFLAVLEANTSYDQLRLIAAEQPGFELVRVDRGGSGGAVRIVPEADLQPKGDRPYFLGTVGLEHGQIHVSEIELNRELGTIDPRHVPVLRLSTPVHDPGGDLFGILVINVDMRLALDSVRTSISPGGRVYLANQRGDFLVHPDRSKEFSRDLGLPALRGDELPELDFLRSMASPSPFAQIVQASDGSDFGGAVIEARPAGGDAVAILETVPYASLLGPAGSLKSSTAFAALAASAVAVCVAFFIARSLTRPLIQMTSVAVALASGDLTSPVPVDAGGEIGVLARAFDTMRSNIQRKNAALQEEVDERRHAEERFRLVVEACPSGIVIVDAKGTILMTNAETCRMFGWKRNSLEGQPIEALVPARYRARHPVHRNGYLLRPVERRMGEGRDLSGLRKDGTEFPVEIGLNPIELTNGTMILGVIADITERKEGERILAEHQADLERSNAELEQFAYVASHDLQEPLRMVASYTELLGQRYRGRLDERADKYIHYTVDGARRMQQLVNDLLAFSRVGTQGREPASTDSRDVLDRVLKVLERSVSESGGRVICGDLPTVWADEVQLAQVFQNLISNALKFRSDRSPEIRVGGVREGPQWLFSVADNGIGIDMSESGRIFQMFQRLHGRGEYEGSGIGLSLVKKIVERHRGRVWFESEPGHGTTFFFTFPATGKAVE